MPVARPESSDSRIIAHVDMDCFYVQVEQRKQPKLRGLATAVVQYNEWKGGALIAVSYEARKCGVKRSMRGDEAKQVCPEIQLVQVPVARSKADLSAYRNAGSEVVSILSRKGRCERASIDEVYLDLTNAAEAKLLENPPEIWEEIDEETLKSHILGLGIENGNGAKENVRQWLCRPDADRRDKLLACGALIVSELRMQVLKETEFTCSAGIAHNKMLAKLASGMNKPAQQTVVPLSSVKELLDPLPIKKMKQLGGKLGTSLQTDLRVNTVGELLGFSEEKLQELYGINTGTWLWNSARGINGEEVQGRLLPKSHGSGKSFPGPRALKTITSVQHWLNQLCEELNDRLCSDMNQNKRIAHTLTLHASAYKSSNTDSHKKFPSKSCPLRYGTAKLQEDAFNLFQAGLREYLGSYGVKTQANHQTKWEIRGLSISASKIVDIPSGTSSIMKYFHGQHKSGASSLSIKDNSNEEVELLLPSGHSESESFSELKYSELQIDQGIPCIDPEQKDVTKIDQGHSSFSREASPSASLPSESENCKHNCHGYIPGASSGGDPHVKPATVPSFETPDQKKKNKGTILEFFKNQSPSCSSPGQVNIGVIGGSESRSASSSECTQVQPPKQNFIEKHMTSNDGQNLCPSIQSRAWNYRIDEIDPSVIDELPPEIQDEIQTWLRPRKRPNIIKRGSTIAHYFVPPKST